MVLPYCENFIILSLAFWKYWQLKGRKSPTLPIVTLKPGSGFTQGHWFWYQWKARVHIPISDQ